jgi:hypothetical protein
MFHVHLMTDNAAFEVDMFAEVARILRACTEKLARGETDVLLFDVNGNRVGEAYFE